MITFTILVAFMGSESDARAWCENMYWNKYNSNEKVVRVCEDVWEYSFNYIK